MVVQEEYWRQLRAPKPSRGFTVAGRREIQQSETLEEQRVAHRRVQGCDESFGRIELVLRHLRVGRKRSFALTAFSRVLEQLHEASYPQQGQRKACRQQRVDHASRRWEQRPPRSTHLSTPEGESCIVDERHCRVRGPKLFMN